MVDALIIRQIAELARNHVLKAELTPPISLNDLKQAAAEIQKANNLDESLIRWIILMFNNAIWQDVVAGIPFKRRLLMIPQCLKHPTECPAETDELGLLCEACGRCVISEIVDRADELGLMCIVAEGSTMTAQIIEKGQADAIIGVGCFSALEKAFEQMVSNAVPGLALPLFYEGCVDTKTDTQLLLEMLSQNSGKNITLTQTKNLLDEVKSRFSADSLNIIMGAPGHEVDSIARDYLAQAGKRYRPFLCMATIQALGCQRLDDPDLLRLIVAVECFHKASLIHDDIEDNDSLRDGLPTLHVTHGLGTALNTGDLLLGEGYRMISETSLSAEKKVKLLNEAVTGHLTLCHGQGHELLCSHEKREISLADLLEIFSKKTAPAFNVAFQFAAIYMQSEPDLQTTLASFSRNLGIAYQIKDDMIDCGKDMRAGASIPSVVDILMKEENITLPEARTKAVALLEDYRNQALNALNNVKIFNLKRFLFQVTYRILKIQVS